jgi:hypothetical protein
MSLSIVSFVSDFICIAHIFLANIVEKFKIAVANEYGDTDKYSPMKESAIYYKQVHVTKKTSFVDFIGILKDCNLTNLLDFEALRNVLNGSIKKTLEGISFLPEGIINHSWTIPIFYYITVVAHVFNFLTHCGLIEQKTNILVKTIYRRINVKRASDGKIYSTIVVFVFLDSPSPIMYCIEIFLYDTDRIIFNIIRCKRSLNNLHFSDYYELWLKNKLVCFPGDAEKSGEFLFSIDDESDDTNDETNDVVANNDETNDVVASAVVVIDDTTSAVVIDDTTSAVVIDDTKTCCHQ